jgi:hypothetical protein
MRICYKGRVESRGWSVKAGPFELDKNGGYNWGSMNKRKDFLRGLK